MSHAAAVQAKIQAYHDGSTAKTHHRYRSWEHCYGYFRRVAPGGIAGDREHAALQLGFYLASWGMYRGSSFLLDCDYTVHLGVVDLLCAPRFSVLWEVEFGSGDQDAKLAPLILEARRAVRVAYRPFVPKANSAQPTDTLLTKVLLGTFGCLPACDRYFIAGFKTDHPYSYLNEQFVRRVSDFSRRNLRALRGEQARIENVCGVRYPLMKLVDMHFFQIGYELSRSNVAVPAGQG